MNEQPNAVPKMSPERIDSFWSRVDKSDPDGCWPWTGTKTNGIGNRLIYGVAFVQTFLAHRVAYSLANGDIPEGLYVLHSCDSPLCCNPAHLRVGTKAENNTERHQKGRSGHASQLKGELNKSAKLTEDQANEIRTLFATKQLNQTELAAKFGVGQITISDIISGQRYTAKLSEVSPEVISALSSRRKSRAKLTDAQAAEIRAAYAAGGVSQAILAARYGVSQETISALLSGEFYCTDQIPAYPLKEAKRGRPAAKLTLEQVAEIRRLCSIEHLQQKEIASRFGISRATVCQIVKNQIYKI